MSYKTNIGNTDISIEADLNPKESKPSKIITASGDVKYVYNKSKYIREPNKLIPPKIEVEASPDLDKMVRDGLAIISYELSQYRHKAEKGKPLDSKEARVVTSYIEALTKMSKEARESKKPELLAELSDAQLLELVQQSLANRQDPKSSINNVNPKPLTAPKDENE